MQKSIIKNQNLHKAIYATLPWFRLVHHFLPLFLIIHRGPEGTPFEDGIFTAKIVFPNDYPLSPPKMRFVSEMFHPNGMN